MLAWLTVYKIIITKKKSLLFQRNLILLNYFQISVFLTFKPLKSIEFTDSNYYKLLKLALILLIVFINKFFL